jgi:dehydrogenase/reductase SDR family protein 7B
MIFKDKIVWITGASSGIGEALAYEFAARGAYLILSGRNLKELERVNIKCKSIGKEGFICPLDLADGRSILQAVDQVLKQCGSVHYLVNNGGISQRSRIIETSLDVDRRIMEVNYFGTITLTKAVLPAMIKNNGGHLIVISSLSGKLGLPVRSAYCASKHALHGFFDSLRIEMAPYNIKVTIVCPGHVRTTISFNALEGDGKPHGVLDAGQEKGMPVEKCARKIIHAIERRKRELHIGGAENLGVYLRLIWPWLFFRLAGRVNTV